MLRILVTGFIAQYPLGGMAWHYLQYVLGLVRLGHDVYYLEDTGLWPYNPMEKGLSKTCDFNIAYLNDLMSHYGLGDRWAYRFPWQDQWFGLSDRARKNAVDSADLVINVSGVLETPNRYRGRRSRLVYIDTDPVFTQLKLLRGQRDFERLIDQHDVQFSFGEALGRTPFATKFEWKPTRQPIVLSEWTDRGASRSRFTTVMNWTSYKPIEYQGQSYGQKNDEFGKFIKLPSHFPEESFELAVNQGKTLRTPRKQLKKNGWSLVDPDVVCADLFSYRNYIETSKAEWTVAKSGYVKGRAGWFSERSACYLAAGKPVIVQDTGFSDILPCGRGLVSFSNLDEAKAAVESVNASYLEHSRGAQEIANTFFGSDKVLDDLLRRAVV
jgi:hypothetical protein